MLKNGNPKLIDFPNKLQLKNICVFVCEKCGIQWIYT